MREDVDLLLRLAEDVVGDVDDVVLLGMGGSSLAPEVLRQSFGVETLPRPRHDAPAGDPRAARRSSTSSARSSSRRRSRARRSRRARTPTTSGSSRRAASSGSRSPTPARRSPQLAREREFARRLPGRADDRRPLLGALAVRARAGGADGRRRRAACSTARARWPTRAASTRATRASSSGSRSARAGEDGRDKVCLPNAGRLRPLGRAAGRRVDRQAGQGPRAGARRVAGDGPDRQAQEVRLPDPLRARPGVLPLGVRDRGRRRRSSASTRSTSPTCRRRRTRRTRCSRRGDVDARARGLDRRAARRRRGRPTTSASRRSSTRPRDERGRIARLAARARRATGCVVTHGFGPRYLHSTGQLHKGGPNDRASSCRSSRTTATS